MKRIFLKFIMALGIITFVLQIGSFNNVQAANWSNRLDTDDNNITKRSEIQIGGTLKNEQRTSQGGTLMTSTAGKSSGTYYVVATVLRGVEENKNASMKLMIIDTSGKYIAKLNGLGVFYHANSVVKCGDYIYILGYYNSSSSNTYIYKINAGIIQATVNEAKKTKNTNVSYSNLKSSYPFETIKLNMQIQYLAQNGNILYAYKKTSTETRVYKLTINNGKAAYTEVFKTKDSFKASNVTLKDKNNANLGSPAGFDLDDKYVYIGRYFSGGINYKCKNGKINTFYNIIDVYTIKGIYVKTYYISTHNNSTYYELESVQLHNYSNSSNEMILYFYNYIGGGKAKTLSIYSCDKP